MEKMTTIYDNKLVEILIKLAIHISPRITEQDRLVLKLLLNKASKPGMIIVEIGSFLGNGSTKTIIESMKDVDGTFYCVDTWKGNQNVDWHLKLAEEYSLFDTFLYYVTMHGGQDIVKPMMMQSRNAAHIFKDGSCDLVFIDGDHSYHGVLSDIEMWKSKVKPGGILCGHDCEGSMSDFDRHIILKNLDKDFQNIDNFIFEGVHPGVVRAVDESFGGKATLWAHRDLAQHCFHGCSTIWHVRI